MERPKTVLTIGQDWTLQHSRTLLLRSAGYRVHEARTESDAIAVVRRSRPGAIALFLVCHTVAEDRRIRLVKAVKAKFPQMPVLLLYNGWDRRKTATAVQVDGWLHSPDATPAALLSMVGVLTSRTPGPPQDPTVPANSV